MIVCVYGKTFAPYVEPVLRDLHAAVESLQGVCVAVTLERALTERRRNPRVWAEAKRIYVLPFEVPASLPIGAPSEPAALLRWLFRGAEIANAPDAHEIGWDKATTVQRWLSRGVRVPDTALTNSVEEASAFIAQHEWVILKAPRSCGGHGHYIVSSVADGLIAEARGQRYELELVPAGAPAHIRDRQLIYPAPFFLQRLVAAVNNRGVMAPAQLLRAYIVDGQLMFWAERYHPLPRGPSDWIVTTALGAKLRFLSDVGAEARTLALRAADVIGMRIGVVDLARTATEGAYVLGAYSDGQHVMIDREFKNLPEFRDPYDFDRRIAETLVAQVTPPPEDQSKQPR